MIYRPTHQVLIERASEVAEDIRHHALGFNLFAVPRGGIPAAYLLMMVDPEFQIVDTPEEADVIIDDIIDSGATMDKFEKLHPSKPFYALIDKTDWKYGNRWVIFPWESHEVGSDIETTVTRLLQQIGEDPNRGGLRETPRRVARAWQDWTSGYDVDPSSVLKAFEDGGEQYDEMVAVVDIPFYSHCEHHMAPFFGAATIAYIPDGKIVGLSKLSRLLDVYARRLQVQERLTQQVAHALMDHLSPKGVGVRLKARHLCMESRGVAQHGHQTVTTSLLGVFRDGAVRAEFLALTP